MNGWRNRLDARLKVRPVNDNVKLACRFESCSIHKIYTLWKINQTKDILKAHVTEQFASAQTRYGTTTLLDFIIVESVQVF